jgi:tRNA A22 N-methylase
MIIARAPRLEPEAMSLKSRPDGLDQKLILIPQQKTINLRTYLIQK